MKKQTKIEAAPSMYPQIKFIGCIEAGHKRDDAREGVYLKGVCTEATCDWNICANDYWEQIRLIELKQRSLHANMAPMMAASAN